jgi:hypothetical protein
MVIDNYLIHYKKPSQYIYWGENGVDIYKITDTGKKPVKSKTFSNMTLVDITSQQFREIAKELLALDTGILFNSGQFIFNIFDFDKIPFQEKMRREIVEWRLKKVFPENLDEYIHTYFKISKNRVLSVLFKKSIKEKIEALFAENNLSLIYMGNSTIEILNYAGKRRRVSPDFFIEIDKALSIVVFMNKGEPIYFRKFRNDQTAGIVAEVIKTVNFIKNSYSQDPRTYFLTAESSEVDLSYIQDELSKLGISPLELKNRDQVFFYR